MWMELQDTLKNGLPFADLCYHPSSRWYCLFCKLIIWCMQQHVMWAFFSLMEILHTDTHTRKTTHNQSQWEDGNVHWAKDNFSAECFCLGLSKRWLLFVQLSESWKICFQKENIPHLTWNYFFSLVYIYII